MGQVVARAAAVFKARVMEATALVPAFRATKKNQGGYNQGNQQSGQGGQQQQQFGYQSHPKQLSSGQYHVFTTSLCKRDQKLHKRAVNTVEPAVPQYLQWSEQPIMWSRADNRPGLIIWVIWLWWWHLKLGGTNLLRYSWMEAAASISFIMKPFVA